MPMRMHIQIQNRLSPARRPGRDISLRTLGYSASQVARRDLARYYELLDVSLRGLKGHFGVRELEALARALEGVAKKEPPEPIYRAPIVVEEAVRYRDLCATVGAEDYDHFLQKVHNLDLAARYALVDAVERYLAGRRGEEGWREVGLLNIPAPVPEATL